MAREYGVIEWCDGLGPSLCDQLRSRPGDWAVVVVDVTHDEIDLTMRSLGLGDGFETDIRPVDDGNYGVIYEITARYVPSTTDEEDES